MKVFLAVCLTLSPAMKSQADEPAATLDKFPSQFVELDNVRIQYKSIGEGTKALVFVHGWSCDLTFWRYQVPAFDGKVRMILIDLPGHGKSERPKIDYAMDLFARAVDAVLQDAKVEQAVLAGHSMGTPVIRQFYRLNPKKTIGLIAVDGSVRPFITKKEDVAKRLAPFEGPNYKESLGKFVDSMFKDTTPSEIRKSVKAVMQSADQHVAVSAMRNMYDSAIWKEDAIAVPFQVIMARAPFWGPDYEKFVRKLAPQVNYRVMEGVGHFLMMEQPKEFNEHMAGFLKGQGMIK